MRTLSEFIVQEMEPILEDWEAFARSLVPDAGLDSETLRDHAKEIMLAVAEDMSHPQTLRQQTDKGKGKGPGMPALTSASRLHAVSRMAQEFSLNQLVGEFRAIRASVLRRWAASNPSSRDSRIEELTRFNEAIDEALAGSMAHYHAKLEEARTIFLGILAHDLRGPLHAVGISTRVILRAEPQDAQSTQSAVRILNSVSRMKTLVQDLLDYTATRLGDGLPITRREGMLEPVVKEAIAEVEAAYPGRQIDLVGSCDTHGLWDTARISQMLCNLLMNAVTHGYPDTAVVVEIFEVDEGVTIEIRNKGEPIPMEVRPTMFEPLTSTRRAISGTTSTSGLGLGLYVAAQIATAHHGHVKLVSSDDEETIFSVFLPRAPRAASSST